MRHHRTMLCLSLLLCILLLCACGAGDESPALRDAAGARQSEAPVPTDPPPTEAPRPTPAPGETVPTPTEPETPAPETDEGPQTPPEEPLPETELPYTLTLDAAVPLFDGPGYDFCYVRAAGQDGVYTVVEEAWDEEGNLWGRLKSGAGWVDVSAVRAGNGEKALLTAAFADETLLDGTGYTQYIADDSDYMVKLVFRAGETLSKVSFLSMQFGENGYEPAETLYTLDTLSPETPFVAGVVFYGDMTAYGLTFTDASGAVHGYTVAVSGRNGSLILNEFEP